MICFLFTVCTSLKEYQKIFQNGMNNISGMFNGWINRYIQVESKRNYKYISFI